MDVAAQLSAALADRYCIEREIGAGGMAVVYAWNCSNELKNPCSGTRK